MSQGVGRFHMGTNINLRLTEEQKLVAAVGTGPNPWSAASASGRERLELPPTPPKKTSRQHAWSSQRPRPPQGLGRLGGASGQPAAGATVGHCALSAHHQFSPPFTAAGTGPTRWSAAPASGRSGWRRSSTATRPTLSRSRSAWGTMTWGTSSTTGGTCRWAGHISILFWQDRVVFWHLGHRPHGLLLPPQGLQVGCAHDI